MTSRLPFIQASHFNEQYSVYKHLFCFETKLVLVHCHQPLAFTAMPDGLCNVLRKRLA